MKEQLRKFASRAREEGLFSAITWAIPKTVKAIVRLVIDLRCNILFEKTDLHRIPSLAARDRYAYRFADAVQVRSLLAGRQLTSKKARIFMERIGKGQVGILAYDGSRLIGYIWISFVPEHDRRLGLRFDPGTLFSYGFDLFVKTEFRAEGVGYNLTRRWIDFSRQNGKVACYGHVERWNKPNQMSLRIVFGFRPVRVERAVVFFQSRALGLQRV